MDQLQQARAQIDAIDAQMAALFEQRMQAVGQVARYKAATGKPVFDPAREDAVLDKNTARLQDEALRPYYRRFLQQAMAVSRAYQRQLLGRDVAAYQGVQGAWSHIALCRLLPFAKARAYATWADVCDAVEAGDAQYGVLPFENSNAGDVSTVMDLLYARPGLTVARMADLPIRQDLLALPGATLAGIRTVISHQQALAQSSPFLKSHDLAARPWGNTADAARHVAESGDRRWRPSPRPRPPSSMGCRSLSKASMRTGTTPPAFWWSPAPTRRRRCPRPPAAGWRCSSRWITSPASWPP